MQLAMALIKHGYLGGKYTRWWIVSGRGVAKYDQVDSEALVYNQAGPFISQPQKLALASWTFCDVNGKKWGSCSSPPLINCQTAANRTMPLVTA